MYARELYAQKVSLAKELKNLQLRLSGVLDEQDRHLGLLDEMSTILEMRLTKAISEKELADKEKLEKEASAKQALAFEENQMLKLVEESKRLEQEAVKNSKLQELFKERDFVVKILQGDVSDKYPVISWFRERLDQPVLQSCGFISSSQTPSCFTSSGSSLTDLLTPFHEFQLDSAESTVIRNENTPLIVKHVTDEDMSEDDFDYV